MLSFVYCIFDLINVEIVRARVAISDNEQSVHVVYSVNNFK